MLRRPHRDESWPRTKTGADASFHLFRITTASSSDKCTFVRLFFIEKNTAVKRRGEAREPFCSFINDLYQRLLFVKLKIICCERASLSCSKYLSRQPGVNAPRTRLRANARQRFAPIAAIRVLRRSRAL